MPLPSDPPMPPLVRPPAVATLVTLGGLALEPGDAAAGVTSSASWPGGDANSPC